MNRISTMVVDDEPLAAQLLGDYVRQTPFLSLEGICSSAVEAFSMWQEHPADLLFLDIQMPQMNGLELSRTLGERSRVIFTTAFEQYALEGFRADALDYLLKPYKEQELVFAVEDAIRQVSARSTPLPPRAQPTAPAAPLHTEEEDEDVRTSIIRAEMLSFIEAHYREDISMQDAATALRYSDAYFCKRFKQCFKVNFSAYLNEYRVGKARQLVLDPRLSLKDVSTACGYADANYFTRVFKRITGKTPSEYRLENLNN